MTLFNELLNKRGTRFALKFAPAIPSSDLVGDPEQEVIRLRKFIEIGLPKGAHWGGASQLRPQRASQTAVNRTRR